MKVQVTWNQNDANAEFSDDKSMPTFLSDQYDYKRWNYNRTKMIWAFYKTNFVYCNAM